MNIFHHCLKPIKESRFWIWKSRQNRITRFSTTIPSLPAKKARTWEMKSFLPLIEIFPVGFIFGEIHLRRRPKGSFRSLVYFPHIFVFDRKYNESRIVFPQQKFILLAERHSRHVMVKEESVGDLWSIQTSSLCLGRRLPMLVFRNNFAHCEHFFARNGGSHAKD